MEHTAQVMGIAGAGRGTGVTHFVIQAANYLCSCRQKKTAILQWNPQKDLEKIRAFLGAGGKEDSRSFKKKDHFRLLGVDYYYEGDPAVLAACMEKDYQEILIDFGKVRPATPQDLARTFDWARVPKNDIVLPEGLF